MKNIQEILESHNKKFENRFGHYNTKLMFNWPKIVGDRLAKLSVPNKIVSYHTKASSKGSNKTKKAAQNVLYLQVSDSAASTEVAFSRDLIIEKIAVFFGFKLISAIKTQIVPTYHAANFPSFQENNQDKTLSRGAEMEISNTLDTIEDGDLKNYLEKLGKLIYKNSY